MRALSYCRSCGRQRRAAEFACPACGGDLYGRVVPGGATPRPTPGAIGAPPLRGLLGELLSLPAGSWALLIGEPGAGKTTIGIVSLVRPWVVTSEMSPAALLAYAARLDAELAGISVPRIEGDTGIVELGIPKDHDGDLLLDSISEAGDPLLVVAELARQLGHGRRRALATVQVTKDGQHAGPARLRHAADTVIDLRMTAETGRMAITKNRHGRLSSSLYQLDASGPRLPRWAARYYSIEGRPGGYHVAPYPGENTPHADPWRAIERGELAADAAPAPPCATAARASKLYGGGFAPPADIEERRAFSVAHGLEFWLPGRSDGISDGS